MNLPTPLNISLYNLGQLAQEAGQLALSYFGKVTPKQKPDRTLVSEADQAVEMFLTKKLFSLYPHTGVLGEEFGRNEVKSDHLWILDPIDGTAAFLGQYPIWGVSIGYLFQGKPLLGAFYMPVTQDLFLGDGQNAYWNDEPLAAGSPGPLHSESLLLVPSNAHRRYKIDFIGKTRGFGSAAAHVCYLAAGKTMGALLGRAKLWDIAGAWPILHAIGGDIYTLTGSPISPELMLQTEWVQQPLLAAPTWFKDQLSQSISVI